MKRVVSGIGRYLEVGGITNGVDLTGLLGGGHDVPQKLKFFCKTTHNICINIQQTTVVVILADILNKITSKILGGGQYHGCPPPS